ncbi:MAG: hypothetical protein KDC44_23125, partial [Phaeodactylibacter sp.]|nr:hypothetical protein [Phaeodactylibacter sp.]
MYQLKIPFVLFLVLSFPFITYSQVVWTDPVFPKLGDEVTVYFDASQGTGELAGCNCDVYVHTGLITSESTSPGDWKNVQTSWAPTVNDDWKLTPVPGEEDLYSYVIGPDIETYYNVLGGQEVESMAFVFRNADGSKTGKAVGGLDIFYPVYPDDLPFTAVFITPGSSQVLVPEGATITIRAASSETADLSLYDNGDLIGSTNGTLLEVDVTGDMPGTRELELVADNGLEIISVNVSYVIPNANLPQLDPPAGTELGANFLGDTSMILALYAPDKEFVFAYGSFSDWALLSDYQMRLATDGGTWWVQIDELEPGETYMYQYLVDGQLKIADPYSTLILDPNSDDAIPEETYPDMPDYPFDQTSGFVSVVVPGEAEYPWQITAFEAPAKERLTVYELLVRDFIARHDYTTLIDTLDYLEKLGVNAIELMPVQEFENNNSWGYNPSFHMA